MTYVMAGIHGMYDAYRKLLDMVEFSEEDTLFVLGDVADLGPAPCKVLQDMSCRSNVFPILGDHDFMAAMMLKQLLDDPDLADEDTADDASTPAGWLKAGGQTTYDEFVTLSEDLQEGLLEYIDEFSLYEVVTVGEQKFILVHGGLGGYDPAKKMAEYSLRELLYGPTDYEKLYYKKSVLVTAHVPTFRIDESSRGKVFHGARQLAIDCGAGFGEKLGCVCLDSGEEFYA